MRLTGEAGYDPRAMLEVMRILEETSGGASGPEFAQTHPNPGNRIAKIEQAIQEEYPKGLPEDLIP
nr:M48 family metalloprotease [Pontibacter fetidus]